MSLENKAKYIYAILINIKDMDRSIYTDRFVKDFKREFKSYDYLCGYVDGVGFGKIKIKTCEEIEQLFKKGEMYNYYLMFVKVESNYNRSGG